VTNFFFDEELTKNGFVFRLVVRAETSVGLGLLCTCSH